MGAIIGAIIARTGWPEKAARAAAYAGFTVLLLAALWGGKCAYDRSVVAKHETNIERRAAPATNKAADERANDAIANAKAEQEMHNVIEAQPDQAIAPTSHARACEQLRRAGRNPASCGRPPGGH